MIGADVHEHAVALVAEEVANQPLLFAFAEVVRSVLLFEDLAFRSAGMQERRRHRLDQAGRAPQRRQDQHHDYEQCFPDIENDERSAPCHSEVTPPVRGQ
jgi:hypothetical protein